MVGRVGGEERQKLLSPEHLPFLSLKILPSLSFFFGFFSDGGGIDLTGNRMGRPTEVALSKLPWEHQTEPEKGNSSRLHLEWPNANYNLPFQLTEPLFYM